MPPQFNQPGVFSPAISGAYGASLVENQNNPVLLDAAQNAVRTQLARQQMAQAESARRQQAQSANLALAQRQTESDAANYQRSLLADQEVRARDADRELNRQELEGRLSVSARDVFAAQAAQAEIAKRAQVQDYLMGRELSYQEQLRVKRLDEAVGYVESRNDLSREAKDDLILQARTQLDPYRQRMEAAQVKKTQEQAAALARQQELFTALQTGDQAKKTEALAKLSVPLKNPYTGQLEHFYATPDGELKAIPFIGKAEKAAEAKPFDADHAYKQAVAEVKGLNPGLPEADPAFGQTVQAAFQRRFAEWQQGQQKQPGVGAGAFPGGQGQPPPADLPKPFDARKPDTMTENQHRTVQTLEAGVRDVQRRTDLSPAQKARLVAMADGMLEMLQVWGSPEGIRDPEERALYAKFERALAAVPPPKPSGPPPTLHTNESERLRRPIPLHAPPPPPPPGWLQRNVVNPVASVVPDLPI